MKIKWKKRRSRFAGLVMSQILAFALAFSAIAATPVLDGAAQAVDFNRACSLTVHPAGEADQQLAEDVARANVVVDLYKVADAKAVSGYDTYTYELLEGYTGLQIGENMDNAQWTALAQDAAELALDGQKPAAEGKAVNQSIAGLECGLYLLIARGEGIADYIVRTENEDGVESIVTIANSNQYTYSFAPVLVSLPSKEAEDGTLGTGSNGDWMYDMTATLKPEQTIRYGSLEIVKTLNTYETKDPATFVFDVEAELDGRVVFSDVVSLSFTEAGQKSILVEKLPVGSEVTVKEVYSGAVYSIVTADTQTAPIEAEAVASVAFTNDYNDTYHGGGSVTNHFEYDSETGWGWTQIADEE